MQLIQFPHQFLVRRVQSFVRIVFWGIVVWRIVCRCIVFRYCQQLLGKAAEVFCALLPRRLGVLGQGIGFIAI